MFSKGNAVAELLAYIEEARMDENVAPVFKLVDIARLYSKRPKQRGVKQDTRTHSTELKALQLTKNGCDVLLAFDTDSESALRKVCSKDFDDAAICRPR